MFVVTNRVLIENDPGNTGLGVFGATPNPAGSNELRMVELSDSGSWRVKVLEDPLAPAEVQSLCERYHCALDPSIPWYASFRVACELFDRARKERKHILFYVHGYNNDVEDVIKTARELETLYNVIVVPFSWPANGGGKISGTTAYLDDKGDARNSATALHRAVEKFQFYHRILTESVDRELALKAREKHPENREKAQQLYAELMNRECKITLNLLCHSMGNYVLKYATLPGNSSLRDLVFDNIALVAADANNPGHEQWVETLKPRHRLYIIINEKDNALSWSRRKPGNEQKARLGSHLRNLIADNAYYLDMTRNKGVNNDHSYFKQHIVSKNNNLKRLFAKVFEGGTAEVSMQYHSDVNVYRS